MTEENTYIGEAMKKIIVFIIILLSLFPLFAKESGNEYFLPDVKVDFSTHLYGESVMLYGYPTLGGALDIGVQVDTVNIATYLRYNHIYKPLGSSTGRLYIAEEMLEEGLSFKVRIYERGRFNVKIGINTGWYQQFLMLNSNPGIYNLVHNGIMVRPECSIGWRAAGWWTVELGFFYQSPLYPAYEEYGGWGIFLRVL